MQIVAIVQARCGSSRLPNKVLKKILGKPMLQHQIERMQRSKSITTLIIATSKEPQDQEIKALCDELEVTCFQGKLSNVLDRYYQAAKLYHADIIVRLTGDCPLIDAQILDQVIALHIQENNDYTSNVSPETFPDGLDVEVFNFSTLQNAWENASKLSDLEHVTPYICDSTQFKKGNLKSDKDYSHYRWTVDEIEDFCFVEKIYAELGTDQTYFDRHDIYNLLKEKPELLSINNQFMRNEGYFLSLTNDNNPE